MGKISKMAWGSIQRYINLGAGMAGDHDAAFVLVVAAEVGNEAKPRVAWATSGVSTDESIARSELTISAMEAATQQLRKQHRARFGKEPKTRGWEVEK